MRSLNAKFKNSTHKLIFFLIDHIHMVLSIYQSLVCSGIDMRWSGCWYGAPGSKAILVNVSSWISGIGQWWTIVIVSIVIVGIRWGIGWTNVWCRRRVSQWRRICQRIGIIWGCSRQGSTVQCWRRIQIAWLGGGKSTDAQKNEL